MPPTVSGAIPVSAEGLAATGAVTAVVAETCGSVGRPVALPATVSRTDVTVAVAGTLTFACNWRCAELASSAPSAHDVPPSSLPQPKVNAGLGVAGADVSLMVTPATSPPVAQAVTVHWASCPRWTLDFADCTATQRPTCPVVVVVGAGELVRATGLPLTVAVGVGVADAVAVLVGVAVAVLVAAVVMAGSDVDAACEADFADVDEFAVTVCVVLELDVTVPVADEDGPGVGDGSVLGVTDVEPPDLAVAGSPVGAFVLAEALGEPLELDAEGFGVVGVGVGVVGVGLGVVGVALGDGVAACTGSHCWMVPLAAAAVSVSPAGVVAEAASDKPVAIPARTPPVTKPASTGCTCAIRMRGPASAVRCFNGTSARAVRPPSGHQPVMPALTLSYPIEPRPDHRNRDDLTATFRHEKPDDIGDCYTE